MNCTTYPAQNKALSKALWNRWFQRALQWVGKPMFVEGFSVEQISGKCKIELSACFSFLTSTWASNNDRFSFFYILLMNSFKERRNTICVGVQKNCNCWLPVVRLENPWQKSALDLFPRKIVAYRVSSKNSTNLITSTFRQVFQNWNAPQSLMFHSDQGAQYTSKAFCKLLRMNKVVQSFSKSKQPHDNAVMESFFTSMKREEIYRTHYTFERQFMKTTLDKGIKM